MGNIYKLCTTWCDVELLTNFLNAKSSERIVIEEAELPRLSRSREECKKENRLQMSSKDLPSQQFSRSSSLAESRRNPGKINQSVDYPDQPYDPITHFEVGCPLMDYSINMVFYRLCRLCSLLMLSGTVLWGPLSPSKSMDKRLRSPAV